MKTIVDAKGHMDIEIEGQEHNCRRQEIHKETNKAAGQTIRDNREDRRAIGSGGRLKARGRDTGYMC